MKKIVLTTVLILGIIPVCLADSLTGIVKDKSTGETLIGTVGILCKFLTNCLPE